MYLILFSRCDELIEQFTRLMDNDDYVFRHVSRYMFANDVARAADTWNVTNFITEEYHSLLYVEIYINNRSVNFVASVGNMYDVENFMDEWSHLMKFLLLMDKRGHSQKQHHVRCT